ncbi:unnamed protein product [Spirodela intermedia]|uniref:Uncharacterized protein n=1 Tax=Spirodela intermedia TaxID=51605 RepID=A0ABN7E8Z3_SPIIN|nr:unnamed protein product [Spirodela intermedia]
MATAFSWPMLSWKWMRPSGKTKTSPLLRILVKSLGGLEPEEVVDVDGGDLGSENFAKSFV